ncbi:MAG: hypothetical protein KDE27_14330 [Planctomycetes bacterium]|nr:hypothetical protein [Planctomycetota bacterium]
MIGGSFRIYDGAPGDYVARWDGTSWYPVGSTGNSAIDTTKALALMPNGEVVAAGAFSVAGGNIARWDGTAWLALGQGTNGGVLALQPMPNGHLAVGGGFTSAGGVQAGGFAIWDGTAWQVPPNSVTNGAVWASAVLPNGNLVIGGSFTQIGSVNANHVARWDGTLWHALGTGTDDTVKKLFVLPDGDLLAGGSFTTAGGASALRLARWDGTAWAQFGSGVDDGDVQAIALLPDGTLAAGGTFTSAGGLPSNGYVELPSSCPASSSSTATTCNGPAGPLQARAPSLAWLGSTCRTTATGFAPGSLGLLVAGFGTQSLALNQIHPTGLPGCDLLVTSDATVLTLPVAGEAGFAFAVPNDTALLAVVLRQQYVQAELSTQGALLSLSSSNALALTVGAY